MRVIIALLFVVSLCVYPGCDSGGYAIKQPTQAQLEKMDASSSGGGMSYEDGNMARTVAPKAQVTPSAKEAKKEDAQPSSAAAAVQGNPTGTAPPTSVDVEEFSLGSGQGKATGTAPPTSVDDEEFGLGSGQAPQPRASAPGRPRAGKLGIAQNAENTATDSPVESIAEGAASSTSKPEATSLLEKAAQSFNEYKEVEANQYLLGHWLTDTESASNYPFQWVPGLSEPRLSFRWGVGVIYDAPDGFTRQPPVIGGSATVVLGNGDGISSQPLQPPTRGVRGGKSSVQRSLSETPTENDPRSLGYDLDRSFPMGDFIFYTGDFGERLVKRLESRRSHAESFYGKILAISALGRWDFARGVRSTDVARPTEVQRGSVAASGRYFRDIDDLEPVAANPINGSGSSRKSSDQNSIHGTLIPGVIYLGVESGSTAEKSVVEKGKAAGVDAVLIFHVKIKEKNRSDLVYSTTTLTVHNLKTGESQQTGSLNSETVAKARQKNSDSDNDPVELALDKIFKDYSDEKFRVIDMPKNLTPDIVKKRVDSLVAGTHQNPLPVVAEIMSYRKSGLIDEPAALVAMTKLLGNEDAAKTLLTGSTEEKIVAIDKWMPGNFDLPESGENFR